MVEGVVGDMVVTLEKGQREGGNLFFLHHFWSWVVLIRGRANKWDERCVAGVQQENREFPTG